MPFLIAAHVDKLAATHPNERFALVTDRVDSIEGSRDVSWSDFRRSVDRTAAWIAAEFGVAEPGFPSLAFLSTPFDFRYTIFMIAAIKTGYKIFLPSPRNSPEFHTHLLGKLACSKFISAQALGDWAQDCKVVAPPSLDELLDPADVQPYPYTKTWEEAKDDKIIAVHSSGSTGPPKPIVWTNGWMNASEHLMKRKYSATSWFEVFCGDARMVALPLFHTAGLILGPIYGIMMKEPMTLFPATAMLNVNAATKFVETFDFKSAFLPPSILEDISADPTKAPVLKKLRSVGFGGGPVAAEAGEILDKYTTVYTAIGSSEASMYPLLKQADEIKDKHIWWQFEDIPGFDFEVQDDGLFELVFKRTADFDWPIFHTFPDIDRYETNDLYEKHPSAPKAWRLISRKDDVLVLSNGEKAVPMPMEDIIRMAPEVKGVLYAGHGKFTVSAVIELTEEAQKLSKDEALAALAPYLEHANSIAPGFARITPNMIIFTGPEKPMQRTAKGSIIRKAVLLRDYKEDIDALYNQQDSEQKTIKLVQDTDEAGTVASLTGYFKQLSGKYIDPEEDFFQSAGVDSMQVLSATRVLRASVQAEASKETQVAPSLIYDHPTIKGLAAALRSLIIDGATDAGNNNVEAMDSMLLKYTEGIPRANPTAMKLASPENVVLTGSTGSIGSYMIDILIRDPSVKHIFALNRAQNAPVRQKASNSERGLSTDFSKVTFLTADFGSKNIGLSSTDAYRSLLESADLIIHNAWPVNFNHGLSSFEPHIRGVRNFIDLAAASPRAPQIVFISSIGTTAAWDAYYAGENRPEALLRDARVAAGQGYGESKYVGEHLLNAASKAGVNTTIARVGQVAGPVAYGEVGMWNRQEWFPSIIASSKYLGVLPNDLGNDVANWIPVDSMAQIIIELGVSDFKKSNAKTTAAANGDKAEGSFSVYNLVNPHVGSYKSLVDTIKQHLPEIKEVVSFGEWVAELRKSTEREDNDATQNPGTKLLDTYEGMVGYGMPDAFDTGAAVANSKAMSEVKAVDAEWMDTWMKQWRF